MKNNVFHKIPAVFGVVIICIFCIASLSRAEIREGSTTVSIFAGGYTFDHDLDFDTGTHLDLDTGFTAGLGLGYNFTRHVGLEGVFNYIDAKFDRKDGLSDKDVPSYLYRLDLLYHLMPEKRLVPFLAVGVGGISYVPSARGVDTRTDFLANYGLGLKYFMTPSIALRGDVRHVITINHGDGDNNLLYTLGLMFAFGGKAEEAAAPPPPPPAPEPVPAPEPEAVTPPPPPPAPAPEAKEAGTYVFRNIYFDFNKANIKPESEPILDEVSNFLKANPDMKMEVQGHTDNIGTAEYNMKLSERRAEAVKAYLVKDEAIKSDRLTTKGYGLTMPVADNSTAEGRAKNRRVEFKPME
jgi:OOP family OmpA-OmpF porin